ncbi:MAG: Wzz/FepE/Etk N-terminal domain-containing protein [Candidatus Aminicenantes bacterium]|nr:Wzz/FepE/Etk N-terminal domain-containing protein [Candidatus Aminicenantes bacterium]
MHQQEEMELEGIDLMEYVNIAWKHRWQIIIPTVVLAVLAGIVSFLLPKFWEVDAIIIPSKFLTQNQTGEFKQVLVVEPKQIAGQISQGAYNSLIGAELNIPAREFPKIKAENLRDTNLVSISVREKDPQKGKQILLALFNHLKSEFDKKIDVEIKSLDTQIEQKKNDILDLENEIKTRENDIKKKQNDIKLKELDVESRLIEKDKTNKEIESDKNKLKITEERIAGIQEEMKSIKTRVDELDKQQQQSLAEKKEGTETLALLLYSNEVQRNLQYYNTLSEKISSERLNTENLTYSIKSNEQELRQIDNQVSQIKTTGDTIRAEIDTINNEIRKIKNTISNSNNDIKLFEDKKNRIDYTQLVKDPTPSFGPVFPNKRMIVLIAGFLGFCLSSGIVLFRENMEKRKRGSLPKT